MSLKELHPSVEEEVSNTFVQRLHGEWAPADQASLESRLTTVAEYAEAYRLAEESASLLSALADTPEMIRFREQALAYARRSNANRWLGPKSDRFQRMRWVAGAVGIVVLLVIAWQFSPWAYRSGQYCTGIGEQRIVELDDHSRVALDATSRIEVRYTNESRSINLIEGQAQFSVARDQARPFRVIAGDRTIVALGTVFTVEYTHQRVHVAMLEGKVAVVAGQDRNSGNSLLELATPPHGDGQTVRNTPSEQSRAEKDGTIELSAGEEMYVARDGQPVISPKADLEAATAWRNGKVIFRAEPLANAVERVNRYSAVQIEIVDPKLAAEPVSGVFEAGDVQGFITGIQLALPVLASYRNSHTIRLSPTR